MKSHLLKNRKGPQLSHTQHPKRYQGVHISHQNQPRAWRIAKPFTRVCQHISLLSNGFYANQPFCLHSLWYPLQQVEISLENQQRKVGLVAWTWSISSDSLTCTECALEKGQRDGSTERTPQQLLQRVTELFGFEETFKFIKPKC